MSLPRLSTPIPERSKVGESYIDSAIKKLLVWYEPTYTEVSGTKIPTLEIAYGTIAMVADVVVESEDEAVLPRHIVQDKDLLAPGEEIDIRFGTPD